jgi:AraC-like DNA-binding protein
MKSSRADECLPAGSSLLAGASRARPGSDACAPDTRRKVDRSIAYMAQHINRPLQVATLAAMANVSTSHFFALFKQRMGCPPMDYFTRMRMRRACELFDSTAASVKEVAAMMGYDDPFYFSRVFKSVSALPPVQYRNLAPALRQEVKGQIAQDLDEGFLSGYSLNGTETGCPRARGSQLVNQV